MLNNQKKRNNDNILKKWFKLAEPNKKYFTAQIVFYCIYAIFLISLTVFAAQTINCMYEGNWKWSFIFLMIELLTIVCRNTALSTSYRYSIKQYTYITGNVSRKIYNKFISCKDSSFNNLSKEKVTNIALNNFACISGFAENVAYFIGDTLQVVVILITVFMTNVLAGAIVVGLGIVNLIVFYLFNKKLGHIMRQRYEKKDDMFKSYSKVIDGKEVIKELHGEKQYQDEFLHNVNNFSDAFADYCRVTSLKTHWYYIFWNVIIYAISAFLLFTVSTSVMEIAIYLVVVPYIKSCTEKLNTLYDKITSLENMRVDVDRVNLILNLSDEELIKYGDLNKDAEGYNLGLIGVTEHKKEGQRYDLVDVNMNFACGKINVVKGPQEGGKRVIFDLLRRHNTPDEGRVLLDNLDLYDYNEKTFKNHINYCASHPLFVADTIKKNLLLANSDMVAIEKLCAEVGILNDIQSLPDGFDTLITDIKSSAIYFMIGLVRALLTNCKILMIYEIPQDTPSSFRKNIKNIVSKYNVDKTIILFTHSNEYDDVAERIYSVSQGVVEKIK